MSITEDKEGASPAAQKFCKDEQASEKANPPPPTHGRIIIDLLEEG